MTPQRTQKYHMFRGTFYCYQTFAWLTIPIKRSSVTHAQAHTHTLLASDKSMHSKKKTSHLINGTEGFEPNETIPWMDICRTSTYVHVSDRTCCEKVGIACISHILRKCCGTESANGFTLSSTAVHRAAPKLKCFIQATCCTV